MMRGDRDLHRRRSAGPGYEQAGRDEYERRRPGGVRRGNADYDHFYASPDRYALDYGFGDPDFEAEAEAEYYDYGYGAEYGYADEYEYEAGAPPAPTRAHFHGYGMGYGGGAYRSRGSFFAGQLRSGMNPADEFEFEWGDGYVGGRGYGGTNYDLRHGYRIGRGPPGRTRPAAGEQAEGEPRGGFAWGGESRRREEEPSGPARYGYGPYHERLRRQRRSDDQIRDDVEETLFYDTWVDADRIRVEVQDGIVTLSGTLPNHDEVRYATDDAWDVDGVRGVRTEIEVAETAETSGTMEPVEAREPGVPAARDPGEETEEAV